MEPRTDIAPHKNCKLDASWASKKASLIQYIPSVLLFILIIVVWQVVQSNAGNAQYALPTPATIFRALVKDRTLILRNAIPTLAEAIGGFLIGNVIAISVAVLFTYSRSLEETLFPVAVAIRSIPLVAIIPILVLWMGSGFAPKVIITAMMTFFPTLVNMVQGLNSIDSSALEMMHVLHANKWQVFWKLRLPYSLPHLFAALRVTASGSILGAMTAEWIGSISGLGYAMVQAMYNFEVGRVWSLMIGSTLLSILAYGVVALAEKFAIPWHAALKKVQLGDRQ